MYDTTCWKQIFLRNLIKMSIKIVAKFEAVSKEKGSTIKSVVESVDCVLRFNVLYTMLKLN